MTPLDPVAFAVYWLIGCVITAMAWVVVREWRGW